MQTQISLIRVYTVCNSLYIFWMHYSEEKPSCSTFRVITANFQVSEILGFLRYTIFENIWIWNCFTDHYSPPRPWALGLEGDLDYSVLHLNWCNVKKRHVCDLRVKKNLTEIYCGNWTFRPNSFEIRLNNILTDIYSLAVKSINYKAFSNTGTFCQYRMFGFDYFWQYSRNLIDNNELRFLWKPI